MVIDKRFPLRGLAMVVLMGLLVPVGCSRVDETGRRRIMLITPEQEHRLGAQAYSEILEKEQLSTDARMNEILQRVGGRIAAAANQPDFAWEFRLIESDQANAFCLPGGKVAVYTGLLPIAQNEAGLAAVVGHEVAHATARHGAERLSQQMSLQAVSTALSAGLRQAAPQHQSAIMTAFGAGTTVGVTLPYSRAHESEADQLGLMYAARAGYDPREAVPFWERMQAHGEGRRRPPAFLATHPPERRRIEQLQAHMPAALAEYQRAPQQHGLGEQWQRD
jgi:metalloendopeptidase OMA1, mitochondrial